MVDRIGHLWLFDLHLGGQGDGRRAIDVKEDLRSEQFAFILAVLRADLDIAGEVELQEAVLAADRLAGTAKAILGVVALGEDHQAIGFHVQRAAAGHVLDVEDDAFGEDLGVQVGSPGTAIGIELKPLLPLRGISVKVGRGRGGPGGGAGGVTGCFEVLCSANGNGGSTGALSLPAGSCP